MCRRVVQVHYGHRIGAVEQPIPDGVDLVIGADGIHSAVRRALFGDETAFLRDLGLRAAAFVVEEADLHRLFAGRFVLTDTVRRQAGLYSLRDGRVAVFLVYRDPDLPPANQHRSGCAGCSPDWPNRSTGCWQCVPTTRTTTWWARPSYPLGTRAPRSCSAMPVRRCHCWQGKEPHSRSLAQPCSQNWSDPAATRHLCERRSRSTSGGGVHSSRRSGRSAVAPPEPSCLRHVARCCCGGCFCGQPRCPASTACSPAD